LEETTFENEELEEMLSALADDLNFYETAERDRDENKKRRCTHAQNCTIRSSPDEYLLKREALLGIRISK